MPTTVLLDACVLYPAYLRDTLLRLANHGAFRPVWSASIIEELGRALSGRIGADRASALTEQMTRSFPDAAVTGYETVVDAMANHPKDRHVLAAAMLGRADVLLTFNLDDFPVTATSSFDIDVVHPDAFLLDLMEQAPASFLRTLAVQVDGYRRPSMSIRDLTVALARCGCPSAAQEIFRRSDPAP